MSWARSASAGGAFSPASFALIRFRHSMRGDNGNLLVSISTVSRSASSLRQSSVEFIGRATSRQAPHRIMSLLTGSTLLFPKKFVLFSQHGDDLIVLRLQFWQNGHH